MALIQADFYVPRFGEAWFYLCQLFGSPTDHIIHDPAVVTRLIFWAPSVGTTPGFFYVECSTATDTYLQRIYANDTIGVTDAPLTMVGGQATIQTCVKNWDNTIPYNAGNLAFGLIYAWAAAVASLTGGTVTVVGGDVANFFGSAYQAQAAVFATAKKYADFTWMAVNVVNTKNITPVPGTETPTITVGPSFQPGGIIVQAGSAETVIPDVDVAINNGSAIYSVMSQTFTFP